jgi:hypothetical protein
MNIDSMERKDDWRNRHGHHVGRENFSPPTAQRDTPQNPDCTLKIVY